MRKLVGIQYLRAVAALAVLLFHAASRFQYDLRGGGAGVDIFFVISGFLMVAITTPATRPLIFIAERIERIVPIYWLATTVMVVGALAGLFPNLVLDTWHTAASYLFLPAGDPVTGDVWPLLAPGWTLNYEMFFYAVFAVLLLLRRPLLIIAALTLIFGGLAVLNAVVPSSSLALRFYTDPIMLEFVLGAWIGYLWKSSSLWSRVPAKTLLIVSGLSLIVMAVTVPPVSRVVLYGIPAAGLLIGVLALERRGAVRRYPLAELCGDASYSIYLWHGLAVSVAAMVVTRSGLPPLAGVVLAVIGGIVGGVLSFWILERPMMRWLRSRRSRNAARLARRPVPGVPMLASGR